MEGYKKAEKIDCLINDLVYKHPITKDNALEWLKFTRTVISSLRILESVAEDYLVRRR